MDENVDHRKWEDLLPDALGLIFMNLSLREILTVVPCVCKSWGKVVSGPYCWEEIDIEEWSKNSKPEIVDRMLRMLIARSYGSARKVCVSGLTGEDTLMFVANHAQSLRTLRIPRSEITDETMERAAPMLSSLAYLDLSYCTSLGAPALQSIGRTCKSLTTLRRVMHPLEVIDKLSQDDDEALAIARTMPRLKHLEIAYLPVDTSGILRILEGCEELELLDVRGCWNVDLEDRAVKGLLLRPRLKVVGPVVVDCYDFNGWDNCSEYSAASSGYLAWDFVAGEVDEFLEDLWDEEEDDDGDGDGDGNDVEMWFYDDVNAVDNGFDWPQSP